MSKKDYGKWIARHRKAKGLTQTELAELIGFEQAVISYVETGNYNISLAFHDNITEKLEADPVEGLLIYYDRTELLDGFREKQALKDIRRVLDGYDSEQQQQPGRPGWQPTTGALEGLAQVQQAQHSRRVFRFNKPGKPALNHNNNNGNGEHN